MAKGNAAQEPSMEEILASIRRIISDDGAAAPAAPAAAAAPAPKPAAAPKPAPAPAAPVVDMSATISEDDLDRLFAQADDEPAATPEAVADDEVLDLAEPVDDEEPLDLVEGLMPHEADVVFMDPPIAAAPEPEPEDEPEEVFELEQDFEPEPEPVMVQPKPKPTVRPAPRPQAMAADWMAAEVEVDEPLVSNAAGASVHAAFGSLTHTILSQNAKTLDDLVKEMLRPMLKSWLDENLPVIVERLVRAEIERVSRGH